MKRVFLFLRIVLIGSLLFAVLTNDLSAQSTKVVRRDTLSRADTARIKRPVQARSVSDDRSIYAVPHDPIRIEETTTGYKITDTDGTVYTFETLEQCGGSAGQYIGSYYLSSIVTGERHNVITFTYGLSSMCQVRYRSESYESGERIFPNTI